MCPTQHWRNRCRLGEYGPTEASRVHPCHKPRSMVLASSKDPCHTHSAKLAAAAAHQDRISGALRRREHRCACRGLWTFVGTLPDNPSSSSVSDKESSEDTHNISVGSKEGRTLTCSIDHCVACGVKYVLRSMCLLLLSTHIHAHMRFTMICTSIHTH